jgi:hypothetical protein
VKVTDKMIDQFRDFNPAARNIRAGLEAALKDVPDVQPFTFLNYPHHVTVLHPPCGTVETYDPAMNGCASMQAAIKDGLCDCENTSPWLRVYVGEQA